MDYLKIGKASDLEGLEKKYYRFLEMLPALLSWGTLAILIILSYFKPIFVAYFIIGFDVYWLLLVIFLGLHLLAAYRQMSKNINIDWQKKCSELNQFVGKQKSEGSELKFKYVWDDLFHIVILPTYNEDEQIVRPTLEKIAKDSFPKKNMILVYAVEERGGDKSLALANKMKNEFENTFRNFVISVHPDGIEGELKGKGANQAYAAKFVKKEIVDKEHIDYNKIIVSVFDMDTIITPGYFHVLTYKFLTSPNPYRASYQPIPVYHNNIWKAPFFARIAASSNTFWQMMQQIRQEKLATYSSHSMPWKALVDINFWSVKMVSEDSRIFWHCFLYYNGDYRVEPLNYTVSMDVCMDNTWQDTFKNLYKQQRRWGWGVENSPYLIFNAVKRWKSLAKKKTLNHIFVQIYGFHSWATNALIIAVIGWMPMLLGGDRFNSTVLSGNLPVVTRTLMMIAMGGLVLSAVISTLLLPPKPREYGRGKRTIMLLQWIILPFSIIIFGAIPALESQTRLMLGKYMGFWVTPKSR